MRCNTSETGPTRKAERPLSSWGRLLTCRSFDRLAICPTASRIDLPCRATVRLLHVGARHRRSRGTATAIVYDNFTGQAANGEKRQGKDELQEFGRHACFLRGGIQRGPPEIIDPSERIAEAQARPALSCLPAARCAKTTGPAHQSRSGDHCGRWGPGAARRAPRAAARAFLRRARRRQFAKRRPAPPR